VDPLFEFALAVKAGQRVLERMTEEAFRPLGLTAAQGDALSVLAQAGPLSLKELGSLLIAEAGHPSRLVDRLVEAGLVERRPAEDDRRRVVLTLTPEGRRLARRVETARERNLELGRQLIGDRDLEPILEPMRELLELTPYANLIERRRRLAEGAVGPREPR
jgi:DNA-binding MarR family transcriptional regulator